MMAIPEPVRTPTLPHVAMRPGARRPAERPTNYKATSIKGSEETIEKDKPASNLLLFLVIFCC